MKLKGKLELTIPCGKTIVTTIEFPKDIVEEISKRATNEDYRRISYGTIEFLDNEIVKLINN